MEPLRRVLAMREALRMTVMRMKKVRAECVGTVWSGKVMMMRWWRDEEKRRRRERVVTRRFLLLEAQR